MEKLLQIHNLKKVFGAGTINEKTAIRDLSLELSAGDFLTVIGNNGAGKSTLLNCIAGVFPADEGEILLDGRNITKMPEYKRAAYIGRVFQDPLKGTAFDMTIEENLAIAAAKGKCRGLQPGITRADKKEFREKLASLGMGLEDKMTQKVKLLSGGQRQRLTIARALVGKPEILIMDDSASALDFATDAALRHAVKTQTEGMTVFIVSQRASSIRQADKILVLDDGCLAGIGTHQELMKSCEVYREICLSQLSEQEVNR